MSGPAIDLQTLLGLWETSIPEPVFSECDTGGHCLVFKYELHVGLEVLCLDFTDGQRCRLWQVGSQLQTVEGSGGSL